ncbi:MAG: hypothetical protein JNK44_05575 [Cyclobacteriaceae bacterium]|nr:hypothetical protein [Cyclobacteriaceae bacterium]
MKLLIRFSWVLLLAVQLICVFAFIVKSPHGYGIVNRDAFSYYIQWNRVSDTANPFGDPVLKDPGHDLVRIPFSFPHLILGLTSTFATPLYSYLIWCCIGVLTAYFSLYLLARAFGFRDLGAHIAAFVHYISFHWLSQLPPLSGNQVNYVAKALKMSEETLLHFGPRQYPHDIFFYPLLFTLLGLTLFGVKKLKAKEPVPIFPLMVWGGLCLLMPFNYLYHWFQFAALLGILFLTGLGLRWWKLIEFFTQYAKVGLTVSIVGVLWIVIIIFQNSQLSDAEGYRFALMGGLTEARFFLLPSGLLLRVFLWSVIILIILRFTPNAILLVSFLMACVTLLNLQVLVGKTIQPGHWSFGVDRIFAWIIILAGASILQKYFKQYQNYFLGGVWFILLFFFIGQSLVSWSTFERMSRWDAERSEVIDFLSSQPSGVVLSSEIWLETDVLIHTSHYSFLPRGAQSAVSHREQMQRLTEAALILGYSPQGFVDWLQIRSVRFFGILYGTDKEFCSTLFYDKTRRQEVIDFGAKRLLPSWDWEEINLYMASEDNLNKKMDWIVQHAEESLPDISGEIVFQNSKYRVLRAKRLDRKFWGTNKPIKEQRYPVVRLDNDL